MDRDLLDVEEHDEDEESQLRPHDHRQRDGNTYSRHFRSFNR